MNNKDHSLQNNKIIKQFKCIKQELIWVRNKNKNIKLLMIIKNIKAKYMNIRIYLLNPNVFNNGIIIPFNNKILLFLRFVFFIFFNFFLYRMIKV